MKVHSIFSASALVCTALISGSLILTVSSSAAEPLSSQTQQQTRQNHSTPETIPATDVIGEGTIGSVAADNVAEPTVVVPATNYIATAYSLKGRTASGRPVSKGLIAADPRVLPLGSRVRLEAGNYSGEYLVADTGGMVKGRRIDIWTPTSREAMRFGKRTIKLTVLSYGGKKRSAKTVK